MLTTYHVVPYQMSSTAYDCSIQTEAVQRDENLHEVYVISDCIGFTLRFSRLLFIHDRFVLPIRLFTNTFYCRILNELCDICFAET